MAGMAMMMEAETEPECYATDDVFLQTLAYCISTHCQNTPSWELERYWKMNVAGRAQYASFPHINPAIWLNIVTRVQPDPKETYQQALEKAGTPKDTLVSGNPLNKTSIILDDDYISNYNALVIFEDMEVVHERFG